MMENGNYWEMEPNYIYIRTNNGVLEEQKMFIITESGEVEEFSVFFDLKDKDKMTVAMERIEQLEDEVDYYRDFYLSHFLNLGSLN
jgi:hypothetical protein